MFKSTFIIGKNYHDENGDTKTWDDAEFTKIVINIFSEYYDGATFTEALGIYKKEMEKSVKVEILWSESSKDMEICEYLKKALFQECIYYERGAVNAAYI